MGSQKRILVIPEEGVNSAKLFRIAKRKALTNKAEWEVVIVRTPALIGYFNERRNIMLDEAASIARKMGGIVTELHAETVQKAICDLINKRQSEDCGIFSVKVGRPRRGWLAQLIAPPLYILLTKILPPDIHISSLPVGVVGYTAVSIFANVKSPLKSVVMSMAAVFMAIFVIELLDALLPVAIGPHNRNKPLIFMLATASIAGRYGVVAGLITSVGSFVAFNFFYVAPYGQVKFNNVTEAVNATIFILAAFLMSYLGGRGYENRKTADSKASHFSALLGIHRLALDKKSMYEVIAILEEEFKKLLGAQTVFFMPKKEFSDELTAVTMETVKLNDTEKEALQYSWQEAKPTGATTMFFPDGVSWRFEPMVTLNDEIGVLGIRLSPTVEIDDEFDLLVGAVADQVALILEHLNLEQIAATRQMQADREKLRSMLLSSVSHDLKTPLASIIGSLSVYRSMGKNLSQEHKLVLIETAMEEAQRLDSFITNILDMTRIESGQIEFKAEWVNPSLIIKDVTRRLKNRLRLHHVETQEPTESWEVLMDSMMTGQVLQNILDNAAKYTEVGTKIVIEWTASLSDGFTLHIRDYGKGIPTDKLEKIFDKYTRIEHQDTQVAGTGLGLAISRAVMRGQSGDVTVANHPSGGAIFTLTLPQVRAAVKEQVA